MGNAGSKHRDVMSTERLGPVRADAQRNIQAVLTAARALFTKSGVDTPIREIAEQAGVGVGTIYRHFPKRVDLIAAVFRHEVDACAARADALASQFPAGEALERWIDGYIDLVATKRGLAGAVHSGDPSFEGLAAYFEDRLTPPLDGLLKAAMASGAVRAEVDAWELIWAIAGFCRTHRAADLALAKRLTRLLLDGLMTATSGADARQQGSRHLPPQ